MTRQSVLVTGGGKGLGRAFADALADSGADVLITGRDEVALRETAQAAAERGARIDWAVASTLSEHAMRAAVSRFGGVDALVCNAAVPGPLGSTWQVDHAQWWRAIEVAVRGTELAIRATLPGMLENSRGRIIAVVSTAGRRRWPDASAYSTAKAGQIKLIENIAGELRGTGVVAVNFDPGLVDIGITARHLDRGEVGDEGADRILGWISAERAAGRFTPVDRATGELVRLVTGAADDLNGHYVTCEG
ncbi:SDR family NAD(P)-dependent oxidoreductase [Amycolatopsis sp. cg5]|uniref:SDR family NAD(P)-dependent oxidoreductase n=1 Tax=Amycolatopsis sp. cg5 TaxID=3238802 RepID=UPI003525C169